ncbi:uncharacterized protein LOC105262307 [Musca domestica]|uniref:Uncharacterized protein LOC105262307 n=1 Tax=Musca domestica TaxID=7370 RepID=A0A1I8NIU4_MUSDO|nr:uncharacterized protein LOC105262307 [Musca domestica]
MKIRKLFTFILLWILLLQVNSIDALSGDKSSPLLNFVRTTIFNGMSQKLMDDSLHIVELLKISSSFMESHRANPDYDPSEYEALQEYIENFQCYVDRLKVDQTNCQAYQELSDYFRRMNREKHNRFPRLDKLAKMFQDDFPKEAVEKQYRKYDADQMANFQETREALYDQLPKILNDFVSSIEENEKGKFSELLSWCQKYLTSATEKEKYNSILEFLNKFIVDRKFVRNRLEYRGNTCESGIKLYRHFENIQPNFE